MLFCVPFLFLFCWASHIFCHALKGPFVNPSDMVFVDEVALEHSVWWIEALLDAVNTFS